MVAVRAVVLLLDSPPARLIGHGLPAEMVLLGLPGRAAGLLLLGPALGLGLSADVVTELAEAGCGSGLQSALVLAVTASRAAKGQQHTFINNFIEAKV